MRHPAHAPRWPALLALLAALPLAVPVRAHAQACLRQKLAEVPLRDDGGFISMPVTIAGQTVSFLVDTGSDGGLLTEPGAARLRLPRDPSHRTLVQGTGGTGRTVPNVRYQGLSVGGLQLPGGSLPVGGLPGMPIITPPVVGLLGADVLSRTDLELDLPHHRISFWSVRADSLLCAQPPAWSGPFERLPVERQGNRLILSARLDGRPITALVDTGARSRILSVRTAARVGVDADRLGVDPGGITAGIDLHEAVYHWHRFASLTIGGDTDVRPVLTVAPLAEQVDLLLGADWFATRQVWISYATDQLFVRKAPPR